MEDNKLHNYAYSFPLSYYYYQVVVGPRGKYLLTVQPRDAEERSPGTMWWRERNSEIQLSDGLMMMSTRFAFDMVENL